MNNELTVKEFYKAFNLLNEKYYEGSLPEPYIVLLQTAKKNAYGWFTPNKVWRDETGEIEKHEIAMSAEFNNRDMIEIIGTLHHEMIHLYCHINEIKDTNLTGRYHNKKFKEQSEARGFVYNYDKPDRRIGWSHNELGEELKETIKGFNLDPEAFKLARAIEPKKTRRPTYRYQCSSCEIRVRSRKPANVKCMDCEQHMEEY